MAMGVFLFKFFLDQFIERWIFNSVGIIEWLMGRKQNIRRLIAAVQNLQQKPGQFFNNFWTTLRIGQNHIESNK